MKCSAVIPNKWYHLRDYPGTESHACPFKVFRDGLCKRHHPNFGQALSLGKMRDRERKLGSQLSALRVRIALAEDLAEAKIHSPS